MGSLFTRDGGEGSEVEDKLARGPRAGHTPSRQRRLFCGDSDHTFGRSELTGGKNSRIAAVNTRVGDGIVVEREKEAATTCGGSSGRIYIGPRRPVADVNKNTTRSVLIAPRSLGLRYNLASICWYLGLQLLEAKRAVRMGIPG